MTAIEKLQIHGYSPVPSNVSDVSSCHGSISPRLLDTPRRRPIYTTEGVNGEISRILNEELSKGTYNIQLTNATPVVKRMEYFAKMRSANSRLSSYDDNKNNGIECAFVIEGKQVKSIVEHPHYKINQENIIPNLSPKQRPLVDTKARQLYHDKSSEKNSDGSSNSQKESSDEGSATTLPVLNMHTAAGYSRSLQTRSYCHRNFPCAPGELEVMRATLAPESISHADDDAELNFAWDTSDDTFITKRRYKRKYYKKDQMEGPSINDLELCLNIKPSVQNGSERAERDIKLKHNTQCMLRQGTNINNPYKHMGNSKKLNQTLKQNQQFKSVESYLQYRNKGERNPSRTPFVNTTAVHPANLNTLHVSDAKLLKIVNDSNKPVMSRKSSAKYYDVAVNKDLEEYFQVRTHRILEPKSSGKSNTRIESVAEQEE